MREVADKISVHITRIRAATLGDVERVRFLFAIEHSDLRSDGDITF